MKEGWHGGTASTVGGQKKRKLGGSFHETIECEGSGLIRTGSQKLKFEIRRSE